MSDLEGSNVEPQVSDIAKSAIIWGVVAFVLSILFVTVNNDPSIIRASFWAKSGSVLLGTPLGLVGALIGDAIRRFAAPSMVFTSGGIGSLIWVRVFWSIGPQSIGCLIGCAMGPALVIM